jgi:rhomboid protease GluP
MTLLTCGRCGDLVERGWTRCPRCGRLFPALFGQRRRLDRFFSRDHSFARSLGLLLGVVYLASVVLSPYLGYFGDEPPRDPLEKLSPGNASLHYFGALVPRLVADHGEWWRLVLAGFLHLHPIHLLFNLSALLSFGTTVERWLGPARFTVVFVYGSIAGFLASQAFDVAGAGASAGICAFLGAMLAVGTRRGGTIGAEMRHDALRWLVFIALFGLLLEGINNHAHFGGAAGGFLVALAFDTKTLGSGRESDGARIAALAAFAITIVAALLALLAAMP